VGDHTTLRVFNFVGHSYSICCETFSIIDSVSGIKPLNFRRKSRRSRG